MPITERQRQQRRGFVGGSDVAAIVGLSPYLTKADIWASKVFDLKEKDPASYQTQGNLLEPTVIAWACRELSVKVRMNQRRVGENKLIATNCDAVLQTRPELMEAKTCAVESDFAPDKDMWGEPMTDQVPYHVTLQVQAQMYCAGPDYRITWVPAFIGGRGFKMFKVERNDALIAKLIEECEAFWQTFVIPKVNPPEELPSLDILKRIKPQEGESVALADALVLEWLRTKREKSAADAKAKEAEKEMLAAMADPESGTCAAWGVCSWGTVERREISVNYKAKEAYTDTQTRTYWKGSKIEQIEALQKSNSENKGETAPKESEDTEEKKSDDNRNGVKKAAVSRFALEV